MIESRGFVAVDFDVEAFFQYGQQYYLKDLRFVFKMRLDFDNQDDYPSKDHYLNDLMLVKFSKQALLDIYYDGTDVKRKIFSRKLLTKLKKILNKGGTLTP